MDRPRDGWMVTDAGAIYWLINGSAHEVDAQGTSLAQLKPGVYDESLKAYEARDWDESKHPRVS